MKISLYKNHVHLGDTINNLQRHIFATEVYMPKFCRCCDTDLLSMIRFLVTLLPQPPKISDNAADSIEVKPSWVQKMPNDSGTNQWYREPYVKAKKLPATQQPHIACQFDARSRGYTWPKTITQENIQKLADIFGGRLINIGDRPINGAKNEVGISLEQKFDIISSAAAYVGIDSGLSHLALMTNAPVYIVYQEPYRPWFFYPDGPVYISDMRRFIDLGI